jgi:hypothetical protein
MLSVLATTTTVHRMLWSEPSCVLAGINELMQGDLFLNTVALKAPLERAKDRYMLRDVNDETKVSDNFQHSRNTVESSETRTVSLQSPDRALQVPLCSSGMIRPNDSSLAETP